MCVCVYALHSNTLIVQKNSLYVCVLPMTVTDLKYHAYDVVFASSLSLLLFLSACVPVSVSSLHISLCCKFDCVRKVFVCMSRNILFLVWSAKGKVKGGIGEQERGLP